MEEILNKYKELSTKAEDFRQLSDLERKMIVQRFIDQVLYDVKKFKVAVRVLEKWENSRLEQLNKI